MACPEVVLLKKHILVMSFIGRDQVPAPTLKEAKLSRDQLNSAYQQCTQVRSGWVYSGEEWVGVQCIGMRKHLMMCD